MTKTRSQEQWPIYRAEEINKYS